MYVCPRTVAGCAPLPAAILVQLCVCVCLCQVCALRGPCTPSRWWFSFAYEGYLRIFILFFSLEGHLPRMVGWTSATLIENRRLSKHGRHVSTSCVRMRILSFCQSHCFWHRVHPSPHKTPFVHSFPAHKPTHFSPSSLLPPPSSSCSFFLAVL